MKQKYLHRRGRWYEYRRPVPPHLRLIFGKTEFVKSLGTGDPSEALIRFVAYNKKIEAMIRSAEVGDAICLHEGVDLRELVSDLGLTPVNTDLIKKDDSTNRLVQETLAAIVKNALAITAVRHPTKLQVAALAETVRSSISLNEVAKRYELLSRDRWTSKSTPREKQKFYIPIYTAVEEFLSIVPNDNVLSLNPADVEKYRSYLLDRIEHGEIKPDTANRKLINLRKIVKAFFKVEFRGRPNPFDGFKVEKHASGKREPFDDIEHSAILTLLCASKSKAELIAMCRVMMNTGTSCKEICLLTASDIRLDAIIPFIRISENEHRDKVKSGGSRHRDLPLVGDAFLAMKGFPEGFAQYRRQNGPEAASAACNKLLKAVTEKTTYSFRHRIADKLRNSGCSDSLKDSILGHTTPGMGSHYGAGYELSVKRDALIKALGLPVSGGANEP